MTTLARRLAAALALLCFSTSGAWAEQRPLRISLLPFTNTMKLMEMYQPLREHLQMALGRPVRLFSAAEYTDHFNDIRKRDYDLAITAPHFGAWAIAHGAVPVLRYAPTLFPVLVVRAADGINSPTQLKGKVITLSNRLSVSSITGESWLAGRGLIAGEDYRLTVSPTHTTAIMAVVLGEADGAITTMTPVQQAPDEVRAAITVIPSPEGVPHLFTVANPAMPAAEIAAVKAAMKAFGESDAGKAFLADSGYQHYTEISADDLAAMRAPLAALARILPEAGR